MTIDFLDPWVGGGDDQPGFLGQFPGHGPTPTRRGADLQQCGHLLQGALDRAGFRRLAGYVRPSDTRTVSELYRLCRDLADILAVRGWCQQHQVKLHVLAGSLSGITDLAATDTTTTMLVSVGSSSATCSTNSPAKGWRSRGPRAARPAGFPGLSSSA
ncbi:recombinase family protein [Salinispora arenicola]|uniref:recombinase family protein n=1 Tax=Salinispora arenicola TaxID=168697 RepID=UPI00037C3F89|nr:recombinase family protein [Salinispora arenicola]